MRIDLAKSELEKKKWLISRADVVFESRRTMMREREKEFQEFRDLEMKRWKKIEKGVISIIVASFTVLVGLHQLDSTLINYVHALWTIILFGLPIYLITLGFGYVNDWIFRGFLESFNSSMTWHRFYGNFNRFSVNPEQYELIDLERFLEFFDKFGMIATELTLYYTVKKINRNYFKVLMLNFPSIKKFKHEEEVLKRIFDKQSDEYFNVRQKFESNPLLKKYLIYGNALIRYRNGIIIPNFDKL